MSVKTPSTKLLPMKMFKASKLAIKLKPLFYMLIPTLLSRLLFDKFSNPFHLAIIPFYYISYITSSISSRITKNCCGNKFYSILIFKKLYAILGALVVYGSYFINLKIL